MKTVYRETNPEIINILAENFVEDGVYTREIMIKEFTDAMIYRPAEICVMLGYDDDNGILIKPKIVGHLIAYKPDNRDFVTLDQAWNISTAEHSKRGFNELVEWVKSLGLHEIRFETEKSMVIERALRTWNFEEHSLVMQMRF